MTSKSQKRSSRFEMDMTTGALLPKVLMFALPLVLTSVLQLLYNAADVIVVGRFAGPQSLAAVSSTGALINLLVNIFMGLSVGSSVVIARAYGAGDMREVHQGVHTSIAVAHKPLTAEYIAEMVAASAPDEVFSLRRVSLVLAGHYTGGQWRVPGFGALWVPELGFFPEDGLLKGLDYVGGVPQYISPGLGASDFYPLPGRLFNVPVVTTIYLTANLV